jgi:hypothetical protein
LPNARSHAAFQETSACRLKEAAAARRIRTRAMRFGLGASAKAAKAGALLSAQPEVTNLLSLRLCPRPAAATRAATPKGWIVADPPLQNCQRLASPLGLAFTRQPGATAARRPSRRCPRAERTTGSSC